MARAIAAEFDKDDLPEGGWPQLNRAAAQAAYAVVSAECDGLRKRVAELEEALRIFVHAACPVATEINPRGHNWTEAYLDEALQIARATLSRGE
jgi:hypothetical protein